MKIKKGYVNNIIIDKEKKIVKKKFFNNKIRTLINEGISARDEFLNELYFLPLIQKKSTSKIDSPKILSSDFEKKELKLEYISAKTFHEFILKNCNKFYFNKKLITLFEELGMSMANIHNENLKKREGEPETIVHGDLGSSNLLFQEKNTKIFIIDPIGFKKSPYDDIAKLFSTFYLLNPVYKIICNNKKFMYLKDCFLKKYVAHINYEFDYEVLKKHLIQKLSRKRRKIIKRNKNIPKIIYFLYVDLSNIHRRNVLKKVKKENFKKYEQIF